MKKLKNYLVFRRYRTLLPSIVLVALYAIIQFGSFTYNRSTLQHSSFASERGRNLFICFLCVLGVLLLYNLVMMIRGDRNAKIRLCLLPQQRTLILWLDILWMFALLIVMCTLLYFFYQRDFYHYLELLEENQIQGYAQKSLTDTLQSQPLMAFLFSPSLLTQLRNLALLWNTAMLVPVLSTFFLFDEQLTKKKWCWYLAALFLNALIICYLHEVAAILWLCFFNYVLQKQACACWSAS